MYVSLRRAYVIVILVNVRLIHFLLTPVFLFNILNKLNSKSVKVHNVVLISTYIFSTYAMFNYYNKNYRRIKS